MAPSSPSPHPIHHVTSDAGARSGGRSRRAWGWGFAARGAGRGRAVAIGRHRRWGRGYASGAGAPGDRAGPPGEAGPAPSHQARILTCSWSCQLQGHSGASDDGSLA